MKQKWLSIVATFVFLASVMLPMSTLAADNSQKAINEKLGVPIIVYGANLSESEKVTVKEALQVDKEAEVDEITVSGEDLAKYIRDSNPSSRMYSSAKITREEEGKGLIISIVTPDNITQVTSEMYANAMLTAGIEDATVEIAAPKPVTGHSALVGIYKAYEVKTGETLNTERTDVANDELSVATQIAENANITDEQIAELLTGIKQQISELNPATKEEVEQIVKDQLAKLNIELSEQDRQLLVDLMDRISKLDIDFSKLSDQLTDLATKFEDKYGELMQDEGFWNGVKNFFANLIDTVSSWFK
ncbi:DUF1002 domain-containing protein [Ureibacillus sinduriensis]|uniref:DUF1002 domain-containing protein n=1 Tax=Ureibacillus sinduriensis BLB-1 = JCM 15800 TaxID=1384057 RepID=A0A0A3HSV3_9BACL|nr:DUF1002 domain-containing protein [Ureibacillus sinduriensis]KGR75524.1 hypothetical protein CD33_10305 [Ureibacillus sinduriensis BLB-1 = JCM 15800]